MPHGPRFNAFAKGTMEPVLILRLAELADLEELRTWWWLLVNPSNVTLLRKTFSKWKNTSGISLGEAWLEGQIIVELVVMAESLISWQFKLPKLEMILK
eukprot:symbB.v1.2.010869.t1/scaffold716.1/size187362/22